MQLSGRWCCKHAGMFYSTDLPSIGAQVLIKINFQGLHLSLGLGRVQASQAASIAVCQVVKDAGRVPHDGAVGQAQDRHL